MLMLEDPAAVAQAREIADLTGYSILACGIGSLAQALGGDREGAEAGTQKVLAEARRAKLVDMLTFNAQDAGKRVKEGFLALLTQGSGRAADEAIEGRPRRRPWRSATSELAQRANSAALNRTRNVPNG